jgi:hypothetical protein
MSRRPLGPLVTVSQLLLDLKLAELSRTTQACAESRERLAGLAAPVPDSDLPVAAMAQAALLYDRWAEARRAEINLKLARQTVEWIEARNQARQAFGRAEALRRLAERK